MSNDPPIKKYRHGRVSCAIWQNGHEGEPFYTCSFSGSYRDKVSGEWRDSHSFSIYDLFALVRCACDAAAFLTLPSNPQLEQDGEGEE